MIDPPATVTSDRANSGQFAILAGVGFAEFERIVEADGCATVHLRLPLLLHEAQAVEYAGQFAAA